MTTDHIAQASITINASPSEVWKALTDPALVKEYFFGTDLSTSWEVGSEIKYTGEWEGQTYEDKGEVLTFEPETLIETTYFSNMSGLEDKPENYNTVRYELERIDGGTELTVTQGGNQSEEAAQKSEENWKMVLAEMKKLLEKNA